MVTSTNTRLRKREFRKQVRQLSKNEKMHILAKFIQTEPKIWPQLLSFSGRGTKYCRQK